MSTALPRPAIIAIGRNEGERLVRCLASLPADAVRVYVDSGSSDGSVAAAEAAGALVVPLDMALPFTAARARNAGLERLRATGAMPALVQMIDGDCTLAPGWLDMAVAAMAAEPRLAAVFGRLRERHPDASLYNAMADEEWNVPIGPQRACGGIALFRVAAIDEAGGYDPTLIAGEEPDLCWRMGAHGWTIRRIDGEMAAHDAAMMRFSQAWRRAERAGHAFAELVWRHGPAADPGWRKAVRSTLVWGLALPATAIVALVAALATPWLLVVPAAIAALALLQWWRIARGKRRAGHAPDYAGKAAAVLMATKPSQARGLLRFHLNRLRGRRAGLIEHRSA